VRAAICKMPREPFVRARLLRPAEGRGEKERREELKRSVVTKRSYHRLNLLITSIQRSVCVCVCVEEANLSWDKCVC